MHEQSTNQISLNEKGRPRYVVLSCYISWIYIVQMQCNMGIRPFRSLYTNCHSEVYFILQGQLVEYTQDGDYKSGTKLASYLMRNRDKSREKCAGLLCSLREKHLVPVISELSPEMDFHTIETAFIAVVKDYQKESVGPAADEMLEEFIKVKNQICTSQ